MKIFLLRLQNANLLKSRDPLFHPRSYPLKVKIHYMYERENRMDIFEPIGNVISIDTSISFPKKLALASVADSGGGGEGGRPRR